MIRPTYSQYQHPKQAFEAGGRGVLVVITALNSAPIQRERDRRPQSWPFASESPQNPDPVWSEAKVAGPGGYSRSVTSPIWWLHSPCPLVAHGPLLPNQSHRGPVDPHGQWNTSSR